MSLILKLKKHRRNLFQIIISRIFEFFGKILGYLFAIIPSTFVYCYKVASNGFYTSLWKFKFNKFGQRSSLARPEMILNPSNISVGNNTSFAEGCTLECNRSYNKTGYGKIVIGNRCIFGARTHITAANSVIIGDNLLTGRYVLITDNSHGLLTADELNVHPADRNIASKGIVVIGNNVWIGDKVSILADVKIGDGAIIATNAVVTHDVPPNSIVAGVPARVIKLL